MVDSDRIVVDGDARAASALEPVVRAEVAAEYAERLQHANFWQRWWLQREMEREIARRIDERAPPHALY
jgi:hypothetical protein